MSNGNAFPWRIDQQDLGTCVLRPLGRLISGVVVNNPDSCGWNFTTKRFDYASDCRFFIQARNEYRYRLIDTY